MSDSRMIFANLVRKIEMIRLGFSLFSAGVFTVFTLVMLFKDWSNSVYLYIVLGLMVFYVVIFSSLIIFISKRGGKVRTSIKDYKSGLKIFKAILTLIGFSITFSVVSITVFSSASSPFRVLVIISSLLWAIFQIIFQIYRLIKRHTKKRKPKRSTIRQISKHILKSRRK